MSLLTHFIHNDCELDFQLVTQMIFNTCFALSDCDGELPESFGFVLLDFKVWMGACSCAPASGQFVFGDYHKDQRLQYYKRNMRFK